MISNVVKKEIKWLLLKGDFLLLTLSVYLGFVMQKFLESIVNDLIYPILKKISPLDVKSKTLNVFGIDIEFGNIVKNLINLILAFALSYIIIRLVLRSLN